MDIGLETDFHFYLLTYLYHLSLPPFRPAPSEGVGFITRAGKSRAEQNKAEDFIRGLAILSFINLTPWDSGGVFFFLLVSQNG